MNLVRAAAKRPWWQYAIDVAYIVVGAWVAWRGSEVQPALQALLYTTIGAMVLLHGLFRAPERSEPIVRWLKARGRRRR